MASTREEADIDAARPSGDPTIDGLLSEYYWSKLARENFQFTMPDSETDYEATRDGLIGDYPDDAHESVVAMSSAFRSAVRQAVEHVDDVVAFSITEQGDNNVDTQLRIAVTKTIDFFEPAYGVKAFRPRDDGLGSEQDNWMSGDVFVDKLSLDTDQKDIVGSSAYLGLLHGIGHALGLKHGHLEEEGFGPLPRKFDTIEFSVMTQRAYLGDDFANPEFSLGVEKFSHPQSLMMLDIQALQYLYGADYTTNAGSTTYSWKKDGSYLIDGATQWTPAAARIFMTVWDGGGVDTYDFSAFDNNQTIDLAPGAWSNLGTHLADLGDGRQARGNVFNALLHKGNGQSLIENAMSGGGNDTLSGNTVKNRLEGGGGKDDLYGLIGDDTLIGGAGGDQLIGGQGDDLLAGGKGGDLMNGGDGFDLVDYSGASGELFELTPFGRPKDGTWRAEGLEEARGDLLARIEGFVFGSRDDRIAINDSSAAVTVTIDAAGGDDAIRGGDGQNDVETLIGGAGSDLINPGAGKFQAFGGRLAKDGVTWIESLADNDSLLIDRSKAGGDYLLFHQALSGSPTGLFGDGEGSRARGFARLDYAGSDFVDNVAGGFGDDVILGGGGGDNVSAGLGDDNVNGGAGDDALSGGAGDDYLLGGSGADRLFGFEGDDVLDLGDAPAQRIEGAIGGLGRDTLFGGDGQQRLEGNEGDDAISAGAGEDQLLGGTGDDTLEGGAGKDFVTGGEGADWALYTTSDAGVAVDLTATSATGGHAQGDVLSGIENLLGSRFADTLSGGDGANVIDGGEGADVLRGRGGQDVFVFSVEPKKSSEADRIVDFVAGVDVIRLDRDAFADIGPVGTLGGDRLRIGAAAEDKSDRIIYDRKSGELFFDADGKGGADQVRFAVLKSGLDLARGDFEVVG